MGFNSMITLKLFPFIAFILLTSSDITICNGRHLEFRVLEEIPNSVLPEDEMEVGVSHGHLCNTYTKKVEVKSNGGPYEYRPRFYTEVHCTNAIVINGARGAVLVDGAKNEPCSTLNMQCVQQYRIVQLMRRRTDDPDTCWEWAQENIIPYGCECMYQHEEIRFS